MATEPARFRPKMFPPPEFPPRKPALFARTPPAVFPVILGLLGLAVALRRGLQALDLPPGPADLVLGITAALWAFAALAYAVKLIRRPGTVAEDMRSLPGQAGIAAATVGAMMLAAGLAPFAPGLARGLLVAGLLAHAAQALVLLRVLAALPAEGRLVTPVWHLSFVGFIVGGLSAPVLGWPGLAQWLLWGTVPVAAAIWGISAAQLIARTPPPPLRPLLAIHLTPACLFSSVAVIGLQPAVGVAFAALGVVILVALLAAGRWITAAGFSPMWGAFTFPLAAFASALVMLGGVAGDVALVALAAALVANPLIAWRVLKLWPNGTLAARTNAAQA